MRVRVSIRSHRGSGEEPVRTSDDEHHPTACAAPSAQLFFRPDGDVRVCCRNETPLGNITRATLTEIWEGTTRAAIQAKLNDQDYSHGCGHCGAEVVAEGRVGAYPEQFDPFLGLVSTDTAAGRPWPAIMDFTLSNRCNLQCVQCNGDSSSAIRAHRERRPAMPRVYDDRFFEDLRPFLPHLTNAAFAGGEPFLIEENFRVWRMIAEENPSLSVSVVTNATQWNARVEQVLESLRVSLRLSIDGASADTFESIRVGASYADVMRNVDRFVDYARRRGTDVAVNHCLIAQNAHEFPEMLLWADSLTLRVHVSVVRDDSHPGPDDPRSSIVRRTPAEIAGIYRSLAARDDELQAALGLNRDVWVAELARLRSWSQQTEAELQRLWGVSGRTVLMFTCQGAGPVDCDAIRTELEAASPDREVHQVTWGTDEKVADVSEGFARAVGLEPARLVGQTAGGFQELLRDRFGAMSEYRVVRELPDRVDATARFPTMSALVTMVPDRDDRGWASVARQFFTFVHDG